MYVYIDIYIYTHTYVHEGMPEPWKNPGKKIINSIFVADLQIVGLHGIQFLRKKQLNTLQWSP